MSLIAEQFEKLPDDQDDGVDVEHPGEVENEELQEAKYRTDGIAETLGDNPERDGEDGAGDGGDDVPLSRACAQNGERVLYI